MPARFQTRRATVDDLAQLFALWEAAQLPALELESRFTEFQVVEGSDEKLAGAMALSIDRQEGHLHSETFFDFGLTDTLRPLLWERLRTVATNHGLVRLWTVETAPFWKKDAGFAEAPAQAIGEMPPSFGPDRRGWLKLQLRDPTALPESIEKAFENFMAGERAQHEKMARQARALNIALIVFASLLFLSILLGSVYLLTHGRPFSPGFNAR